MKHEFPKQAPAGQQRSDTAVASDIPEPDCHPVRKNAGPNRELLAAIGHSNARMVSFDIFDTVVTRGTGDPASIFFRVGQELHKRRLVKCTPEVFATLRQAGETRARAHRHGGEVSLADIYREIATTLHLEERMEEMMTVEMDEEAASIRAIPQMRETVHAVRSMIGRVIFISDMYLPAGFLKERLRALGLLMPGDALYVSSEFGVQKSSGRLFRIVLENEGLQPHELFHCGDSLPYDVKPAIMLGIGIHHFVRAIHHPSEQILNNHSLQTGGLASTMAGSARLARLEGMHLDADVRSVWETGACVTGPIVLLYAMWIIKRARQAGIKQLHFLARDAYLPYRAVRMLLETDPESGLEAHYICGSRHTYNLLGTTRLGPDEWSRLTTHGGRPDSTIAELCDSLVAEGAVLESHLHGIGFTPQDWSRMLKDDEFLSIRDHALNDKPFNNALMEGIRTFQDLARGYYAGQGFDPGKKLALVDSGWTTRSHAPLFQFLENEKAEGLRMFCMGVVMPETAIPLDRIDTFLFNCASKQGIMRRSIFYPRAVETLFLANHGRTVSFRKHNGKVVPVFAEIENEDFIQRYFEPYQGGFSAFMREMIPHLPDEETHYDFRGLAENLIARFWLEPTRDEAGAWSKIEWEWDPQGKVKYPLARAYRFTDMFRAFVQKKFPECHPQFWTGAALRLSSRFHLLALRKAIFLRNGSQRLLGMLPAPLVSFVSRAGRRLTRSQWPGF